VCFYHKGTMLNLCTSCFKTQGLKGSRLSFWIFKPLKKSPFALKQLFCQFLVTLCLNFIFVTPVQNTIIIFVQRFTTI